MKILNNTLRLLLILMLAMPVLGSLGFFSAPTADMYNTPEAYTFIASMYESMYIMYIMAFVFAISILFTITNRMALVALLILPISINIVGFHAFLDGGLFTESAVMGNVLLLINLYFLYKNKEVYKSLLVKGS